MTLPHNNPRSTHAKLSHARRRDQDHPRCAARHRHCAGKPFTRNGPTRARHANTALVIGSNAASANNADARGPCRWSNANCAVVSASGLNGCANHARTFVRAIISSNIASDIPLTGECFSLVIIAASICGVTSFFVYLNRSSPTPPLSAAQGATNPHLAAAPHTSPRRSSRARSASHDPAAMGAFRRATATQKTASHPAHPQARWRYRNVQWLLSVRSY